MRKLLAMVGAATLLALVQTADAGEATGKIESINTTANTFMVDGTLYQYSSSNTQGVKLNELKDGDTVRVMYEENQDGRRDVLALSKQE
jgi:hypothetical protein